MKISLLSKRGKFSFYLNLWQINGMEKLKKIRNEFLSLHKTLLDIERKNYEIEFGKVTNIELLNLLFEHKNFIWLREFSSLVARIDELFDSKKEFDIVEAEELFNLSEKLISNEVANIEFYQKICEIVNSNREVNHQLEIIKSIMKEGKF